MAEIPESARWFIGWRTGCGGAGGH